MSIHSASRTLRAAIAAAAMSCAGVVPALGQSRAAAATPVPDSARLALALDSIRTAIGATGASAAIIFPGGRAWVGVSGEAWLGTPVTTATVFDAGSITKSYTAALVLRLVYEGVLALNDSLTGWFPDLPGGKGVTIEELLRQTSGLADYARHPGFLPEIRSKMAAPWLPEENLRFIGEPGFASGARWEYSNTNYLLLGLIAARAGKRPYSHLLREYNQPVLWRSGEAAREDHSRDPPRDRRKPDQPCPADTWKGMSSYGSGTAARPSAILLLSPPVQCRAFSRAVRFF